MSGPRTEKQVDSLAGKRKGGRVAVWGGAGGGGGGGGGGEVGATSF